MFKTIKKIIGLVKKRKLKRELLVTNPWDYTHLAKVWGVPLLSDHPKLWSEHNEVFGADSDLDKLDVTFIEQYLEKVLNYHYKNCMGKDACSSGCKLSQVADDLRLYLKNLGKSDISYWSSVWIGISKIEKGGEETLLMACKSLIGHMWC